MKMRKCIICTLLLVFLTQIQSIINDDNQISGNCRINSNDCQQMKICCEKLCKTDQNLILSFCRSNLTKDQWNCFCDSNGASNGPTALRMSSDMTQKVGMIIGITLGSVAILGLFIGAIVCCVIYCPENVCRSPFL